MALDENDDLWVVYVMAVRHETVGRNAVCQQREWDRMEQIKPGQHTLVRAGIATETEAEKLARGTSGDAKPRQSRPRS